MNKLLTLLTILLVQLNCFSKVVLPDVLSDNMVLQQNSYIKLWGHAKARKYVKIHVSWNKKEYKYFTKKDGSWLICIKTPNGSFQPQCISITDGTEVVLKNILIGEVWFCSGQSNMEMTFKGFNNQPIEGAENIIKNSDEENGIRMLRVKRNPQDKPSKIAEGKWMLSSQQNVPNFSATAYYFALKLRKELNLPIGIINSSWGGSSIEGWMNKDLVNKYDDYAADQVIPDNENWKKPCIMYNGMLKPYTNYVVKGFLWYQGESNIGRYATYANKLRDLAYLWRFEWNLGNLPFYIVEIAPYLYDDPIEAAKLREAQHLGSSLIENSGIVCTNDLVYPKEANIVHPSQKKPVGDRLADLALKNTYGIDSIYALSPIYSNVHFNDSTISVDFKNINEGIRSNSELIGFEIAGEDQVFYPAKAIISVTHDSIIAQSLDVPKPVALRYCFKNYSIGNVVNSSNLPLVPFRTDNW